ncbi:chorismate mutase [Buchnera aphidicola]|uniref:chorismate mutase n=1 Tax=Buchnera aphidicola TaxID=9 RepID=UPI0030ED4951
MKNKKILKKLRLIINSIDKKILQLIIDRNIVIKKIILEKNKINYPIRDLDREKKLINKIKKTIKKNKLDEKYIIKIFKLLIKYSISQQKKFNHKNNK